MNVQIKQILLTGLLTTCLVSADASPVLGKWVGYAKITYPTGSQRQPSAKPAKYSLFLRPDQSYVQAVVGVDKKVHKSEGTWMAKGSTVFLMRQVLDGKETPNQAPRGFLVGKGGKSLVLTIPPRNRKGDPSAQPPLVKIVYTRPTTP